MNTPTLAFNREALSRFDEALGKEWLVTNGLGGYASSTILGINTRKYHGLLVAALNPPGDRTVCISKLDEDVSVGGDVYRLGANEFSNAIYPQGYTYLEGFAVSPFPTWTYRLGAVELSKTVFMPKGKNAFSAVYRATNSGDVEAKVSLYPMLTCRHIHNVVNRQQNPLKFTQKSGSAETELAFQNPKATVLCRAVEGEFHEQINWVDGLLYRAEAARGESSRDDCFQPGYFEVVLPAKQKREFALTAAADADGEKTHQIVDSVGKTTDEVKAALNRELAQVDGMLGRFYSSHPQAQMADWLNWIIYAADSFIGQRAAGGQAVIAGYHWFESWGRDTFVSLPGLLLTTGRFNEAKSILQTYMGFCRDGLIPNYVADASGEPAYNTVDGTLWYINAVHQYLKYTGDYAFVRSNLWLNLKNIIDAQRKGTSFGIRLDSDGLLAHGPRLTWMDAEVNGQAVTPRAGKAVEVQALWYNALRTVQSLMVNFNDFAMAEKYGEIADRCRASFNKKFWNESLGCLFDVLEPNGVDASLRPNQLFAIALDYPILYADKWQRVVDAANRELVTPYGLRTLSPSDPKFIGKYVGDRISRDRAYHKGTIWPWLLGPYVTAYLKTNGFDQHAREHVFRELMVPFFTVGIKEAGLGTISEICDADPRHKPRGCISQAWSVAEPLRAYMEDVLLIKPVLKHA